NTLLSFYFVPSPVSLLFRQPPPTDIFTLSLHDALPISDHRGLDRVHGDLVPTEREVMSMANPTTSKLSPALPPVTEPSVLVPRRRRRRPTPARIVAFVILAILALAWLVPVLWAVLPSFKTEAEAAAQPITFIPESGFTLQAYINVLTEGLVPRWAWNSLLTSALITLITVAISALAGYALSRLRFVGRQMLIVLTVASIMIP